ncbi:MAG TPA: response regulator transcription factor [Candidatus Baltobacteraceae bacterium]|nr:response regulator transcription factor [Candidatus Baltobacteraceae bacterium]
MIHEPAAARVMVVGKDPLISRVLIKLLELDEQIVVLGDAPSVGTAPIAELQPDIIILDQDDQAVDSQQASDYVMQIAPDAKLCLLSTLRDYTVHELLTTVKLLAPTTHAPMRRMRRDSLTARDREALAALSDRELEVVRLIAEGLSNKEISTRLSLSDKTVKNHISHILAKMNLTARTQVAVYALRAGLA